MIIKISVQHPSDLTQAQRELIYMLFGRSSHRFTSHDGANKTTNNTSPMRAIDLHLRLSPQAEEVQMDLIMQNQAHHLPLTVSPHQMAHFARTLQQESHHIADSIAQVIESAVEHVESNGRTQNDHPIFHHLLKKLERKKRERRQDKALFG